MTVKSHRMDCMLYKTIVMSSKIRIALNLKPALRGLSFHCCHVCSRYDAATVLMSCGAGIVITIVIPP